MKAPYSYVKAQCTHGTLICKHCGTITVTTEQTLALSQPDRCLSYGGHSTAWEMNSGDVSCREDSRRKNPTMSMKDSLCPRCGHPCKWIDDNCWYRCRSCMLSFKFSLDGRNDGYISYDSKLRVKPKTNLSCLAMRTEAKAYRGNFPKLARGWFWLAICLELLCDMLFRLNADRFTANWTITPEAAQRNKKPSASG